MSDELCFSDNRSEAAREAQSKLLRAIDSIVEPVEIRDTRGHTFEFDPIYQSWVSISTRLSDEDLIRLAQAVERGELPLDERMGLERSSLSCCAYCGHNSYSTDGVALYVEGEPCPHPDGLTMRWLIPAPSGVIVARDQLGDLGVEEPDVSVNSPRGIKEMSDAYAAAGIGHFFAWNTSPSIYRSSDDTLSVVIDAYTEEEELLPVEGTRERLGFVSTDLWWVTLIDRELYADRAGGDPVPGDALQIEVEPGTYELTYFGMRKEFDRWDDSQPHALATLRRVS